MENNELPKIELPQYTEVDGREELTATLLSLKENPSEEPVYLLFKNGDQRSLLEVASGHIRHFDLTGRPANNAIKGAIFDVNQPEMLFKLHDESLKHLLKLTDNGRNFGAGQPFTEIPVEFNARLEHAFSMIEAAKKEETLLKTQSEQVVAPPHLGRLSLFASPQQKPQAKEVKAEVKPELPKSP